MPTTRTLTERMLETLWYVPLIHIILPAYLPIPAVKVPVPKLVRQGGWLVATVGGALTAWSLVVLVRDGNGMPLPYDPPLQLVASGPYRGCRNPMEQGNLLILLGRALASGDMRFLVASAVFVVSHHFYFLHIEEPELRQRFGLRYAAYAHRTPRWGWRVR